MDTDDRVRESDRKWRATGSVDDEVRHLLERMRAGRLIQERLDVAAYCGHAAAAQLSEHGPPSADVRNHDWIRGLPGSTEARIRAAASAAEAVFAEGGDPRAAELRRRVVAWLEAPSTPEAAALRAPAAVLRRSLPGRDPPSLLRDFVWVLVAEAIVEAAAGGEPSCGTALQCAANARADAYDGHALELRAVVACNLARWALS